MLGSAIIRAKSNVSVRLVAVRLTAGREGARESIGEAIPSGWALAWPEDATSGARDLGGWHEHAGEIEVARLIVGERDIALVSAAQATLLEIATHLEASCRGLIAPRRARRVSCQEVPLPALLSHFT